MRRNVQVVRTLRLEEALEAARDDGLSITEFANRHRYNRRTVHRDMEALQARGLPIREDKGRWYLERRATKRTRPAITAEEVRAVEELRKLAVPLRQLHMGRALDSAHGKLASEANALDLANGADAASAVAPWAFSMREVAAVDYAPLHRVIQSIEAALRDQVALHISYRAPGGEALTDRVVEPAQLHYDEQLGSLYLIAWCQLRSAPRVFAVHRVVAARCTTQAILPRPVLLDGASAANAFRVWRYGHVQEVVVRFFDRAAAVVSERVWHPSQRLLKRAAPTAPHAIEMQFTVVGFEELTRWLLQFGDEAEVVSPPELRRYVADIARKLVRRYG